MKRCPKCNRVQTNDALGFCRADGTKLVMDTGSVDPDAGTRKLTSGAITGEPQMRRLNSKTLTGTGEVEKRLAAAANRQGEQPKARKTKSIMTSRVSNENKTD